MSRKSKLILATALFGAALFAASCGGGGGGETTAGTGTGSGSGGGSGGGGGGGGGGSAPPPPPPASVEGRVLALLNTGAASAGAVNPVTICELKSDNKAYCGNDLNPSENANLQYVHEFENGNVVLRAGNVLYFFDASSNTLTKLTTFREVGGTSENTISTGITIPVGATFQTTPNLLVMFNAGGDFVAVTRTGRVIRDSGINVPNNDAFCERVEKGGFTYSLSVDGTSSLTTTTPILLAQAGDRFLVRVGNDVYLSADRCRLVNNIPIASLTNINEARMVNVGGAYYIAIRHNNNTVRHARVIGTAVAINVDRILQSNTPYSYALAGNGFLFTHEGMDAQRVTVRDINGNVVGGAAVDVGANVVALLAFQDRVLVETNAPDVRQVDSTAVLTSPAPGADLISFRRCTTPLPAVAPFVGTQANDGMGTNFNRCVFDDGGGAPPNVGLILYSFVYDTVNARYRVENYILNADPHTIVNQNQIRFSADRVLIPTNGNTLVGTVNLCSTTRTPSISCSDVGLSGIDGLTLNDLSIIYPDFPIKFRGENIFYVANGVPRVGNIFDPKPMPITVIGASGGNATFDLTKFAFSFTPSAIVPCATQIAYLSSPTGPVKLYTLDRANTCVTRILKVFP
jgi:hypothetical protein